LNRETTMASNNGNKDNINGSNPSSNYLQIEQSPVKASGSISSDGLTPITPDSDPSIEEGKDRMGVVLDRIKSRVGEMNSMNVESSDLAGSNYGEEHGPNSKPDRQESGMAIPQATSAHGSPADTFANDELA